MVGCASLTHHTAYEPWCCRQAKHTNNGSISSRRKIPLYRLRQSGFAPGEDPVKALVGAVTGKSNGAAVPAPAPEKPNAADL
ncbi:hypothetical protein GWG65_26545 [Bradyrhizobium sp. CSA207]|nr:hypothetical protein [Bradyrhizobium sp. CSA207]